MNKMNTLLLILMTLVTITTMVGISKINHTYKQSTLIIMEQLEKGDFYDLNN